jgi:hypothetical protein
MYPTVVFPLWFSVSKLQLVLQIYCIIISRLFFLMLVDNRNPRLYTNIDECFVFVKFRCLDFGRRLQSRAPAAWKLYRVHQRIRIERITTKAVFWHWSKNLNAYSDIITQIRKWSCSFLLDSGVLHGATENVLCLPIFCVFLTPSAVKQM